MSDPILITRVFEAPRGDVWREWTDPARFADWFGGADGEVPLSSVTMDARAGGEWRLAMHAAGSEVDWHGAYREVVEDERIVFTMSDEPPEHGAYAVVAVELEDAGDGRTQMRFEQSGGSLSPEQAAGARYGWSRFFDRLAERLAAGTR